MSLPRRVGLPALVLAQALGIVAADRGLTAEAAATAGALALGLGLVVRAAGTRLVLALVLASCAGALALAQQLDLAAQHRPASPRETTIEGRVAASARFENAWRIDLDDVTATEPGAPPVPARVRLQGEPAPDGAPSVERALPGERLRMRVRLRAPRGFLDPGVRDTERALARAGIGAVANLVHPSLHARREDAEGWRPLRAVHALRASASEALRGSGEGGALLAALALGDRGGLLRGTEQDFARLGLTHLLAVSGMNLAMAAGLAYALLRRTLGRSAALARRSDARALAFGGALLAAAVYAVLAGFDVPVRRALVAVLALGLEVGRGRPAPRGHALALAAGLVLAAEPEALFDVGARMSFAASAALVFGARGGAARRDGGRLARARSAADELLATSALALAATAPFAASSFGNVAPAGLLANLVFVPWTGFLLPVSALATAATALPAGAFRAALLAVADGSGRLTLAAVALAARAAPALPPVPPPGPLALAIAGAAAVAAVRARSTLLRVALAGLAAAALARLPPPPVAPPPPRAVFLDVGQGDATLVQGRDAAVLVDAGTALPGGIDLGEVVVARALAALGVRRLDLVVASHADLDHRGGLPAVLERIPVRRVWLPRGGIADPSFHAVVSAARAAGATLEERSGGDPALAIGDLVVTSLGPLRGVATATRNDASLVVRIEVGGGRLLLPGDLEAAGERALLDAGVDLRADVLKLPHHGSRTSSTASFLARVAPRIAVASAPCGGRFGMPHASVLRRLADLGVGVAWTGRDGAVTVALGGTGLVHGLAEAPRCATPGGVGQP